MTLFAILGTVFVLAGLAALGMVLYPETPRVPEDFEDAPKPALPSARFNPYDHHWNQEGSEL